MSNDPNKMLQTFLEGNPERQGQMFEDYIKASMRGGDISPFQKIADHMKENCSCKGK